MARSIITTATRSSVHGTERTTTTSSSWSSTPLQQRPRAGAGRVDEYDYTKLLPLLCTNLVRNLFDALPEPQAAVLVAHKLFVGMPSRPLDSWKTRTTSLSSTSQLKLLHEERKRHCSSS